MIAITDPLSYFRSPANPDANVTVYLGGLIVAHRNANQSWDALIFEGIKTHQLYIGVFIYDNGILTAQALETIKGPGHDATRISISGTSGETGVYSGSLTDRRSFNLLTDFSLMHSPMGGSSIPISLRKGQSSVVGFSIPDGIGYTARECGAGDSASDLYRYYLGDGHSTPYSVLGQWVGIDSKVEVGKSLILTKTHPDFPIAHKIQMPPRREVRVLICNACEDTSTDTPGDFHHYYRDNESGGGVINGHKPAILERKGYVGSHRIGCNATIISKLDPSVSSLLEIL